MRRNSLQVLWESAKCVSLANGQILVTPVYRGVTPYVEGEGGGPGMFTRMRTAEVLQLVINRELKAKAGR